MSQTPEEWTVEGKTPLHGYYRIVNRPLGKLIAKVQSEDIANEIVLLKQQLSERDATIAELKEALNVIKFCNNWNRPAKESLHRIAEIANTALKIRQT